MHYETAVLLVARQKLSTQGATPRSPGVIVDGEPKLCLAAALAYGGLLVSKGTIAAANFAMEVCRTGDKEKILQAYLELGWSKEDCEARLQFNDAAPEADRQTLVTQVIEDLVP